MPFRKKMTNNFRSLLSSRVFVKPLLGLTRQRRIASNGVLVQLNFTVIFVVAQNLNAVVHKVIVWQFDTLLRPAKEQTNSVSATLGWVNISI